MAACMALRISAATWGVNSTGICGPQKQLYSKFSGFGWREANKACCWSRGGSRHGFRKMNSKERKPTVKGSGRPKLGFSPHMDVASEPVFLKLRSLVKPLLFTGVMFDCAMVGSAIWEYENERARISRLLNHHVGLLQNRLNNRKQGEIRRLANQWWNSLSQGERMAWYIIAANCGVFVLWRVPALRPQMVKYFCSNPASSTRCWPMLLSTFSHYSPLHLAANMYVLYSFSTGIVNILGKEQFLALYISAGVFSSFTSYVHKVIMKRPSLSLGASGAIMAVLAATCVHIPEAQLAIIFLPWFTFSAGTALKAILLMDSVGIVLGWHLFDHAAHLGGALFGISYVAWLHDLLEEPQTKVVKYWHELRSQ